MVEYTLSKASLEDMYNVFTLTNDVAIRKMAVNQEEITWSEHITWFTDKLTSNDCCFYTIKTYSDDFIGYIRLHKKDDIWIISIAIECEYRGKGIGISILQNIISLEKHKRLVAFVKEQNIHSQRCFMRAGFVKVEELEVKDPKITLYRYEVCR